MTRVRLVVEGGTRTRRPMGTAETTRGAKVGTYTQVSDDTGTL